MLEHRVKGIFNVGTGEATSFKTIAELIATKYNANIEEIDKDTYSNKKLFFSHRRSTHLQNLPTGRMINIIGFNN